VFEICGYYFEYPQNRELQCYILRSYSGVYEARGLVLPALVVCQTYERTTENKRVLVIKILSHIKFYNNYRNNKRYTEEKLCAV
jgi:hypothetical protein